MSKQLSDGNPGGTILGQNSSDLVGFYGATPVVRYASSIVAPASTAAVSVSATQWGFTTSTQANALTLAVWKIANALSDYGLSTSS